MAKDKTRSRTPLAPKGMVVGRGEAPTVPPAPKKTPAPVRQVKMTRAKKAS